MGDDRKKVTPDQLRVLVEELEYDPALLGAIRNRSLRKDNYTNKWANLTIKLNSIENGTIKNMVKWQQAWRDWKSNIKRKCKTGSVNELTPLETRVLILIQQIEQTDEVHRGIVRKIYYLNYYMDIGKICEVDPLSSDDDGSSEVNLNCPPVVSPITVTVNDCIQSGNGLHSNTNESSVKKRRISTSSLGHENFTGMPENKLTKILDRLAASLEQQNDALQNITGAMKQNTAAVQKQTQAINSLVTVLNEKMTDT